MFEAAHRETRAVPDFAWVIGAAFLLTLSVGRTGYAENTDRNPPEQTRATPPQVVFGSPGYFFKQVIDVSTVRVRFHTPVKGVRADVVTVNGSPATQVVQSDRSGPGEYEFTGYKPPPLGQVEITVAPSGIVRDPEGTSFEGFSWTFQLFAPSEDQDGDGLSNAQEVESYTDVTSADTDHDGLPDPYEITHACLDPVSDQAHPMSYAGEPLPGDDDADNDSVTDLEESKRGTDPCSG